MARLETVLADTIKEIDLKFRNDLSIEEEVASKKYFKSVPQLKKIEDEIESLTTKIEELKNRKDELTTKRYNLDPKLGNNDSIKLFKSITGLDTTYNDRAYDSKKSDVHIKALMINSKAFKNYEAFKQIKRQVEQQFNLCTTEKQRQQVIIGFQNSVDWKALGINIPNMFEITKVEVRNGTLVLNNALPDLTK